MDYKQSTSKGPFKYFEAGKKIDMNSIRNFAKIKSELKNFDIIDATYKILAKFNVKKNDSTLNMCESCFVKFNIARKKKCCEHCNFEFCSNCYTKETDLGDGTYALICKKCRVFSCQPFEKEILMTLKIKELKWFLRTRRVSFTYCKEKSDLVDLIIQITCVEPERSFNLGQFNENVPSTTQNSQDVLPSTSSNENIVFENDWEFINSNNDQSNYSSFTLVNDNDTTEEVNSNFENSDNQESDSISQNLNENNSNNNSNNNNDISSNNNINDNNFINNNNNNNNNNNEMENNITRNNSTFVNNDNVNRVSNNLDVSSNENLNISGTAENVKCDLKEEGNFSMFKPFNIKDVKSEEEILNLSVRQLKLVLTRNYVDYKGCCEKEELQLKAIMLWNQIKKDKEVLDKDEDENICKVCMENVINCVLLECGHCIVCLDCGKRLNECPICRQFVVRALRIFKS